MLGLTFLCPWVVALNADLLFLGLRHWRQAVICAVTHYPNVNQVAWCQETKGRGL